jgi:hypothetical protein
MSISQQHYAAENDVKIELQQFDTEDGSGDLTDELITRGMSRADRMINSQLRDNGIPLNLDDDDLKEIGTLFSVSRCLDILYQDQEARSPTAIQNDKDANAMLTAFIASYLESNHEEKTVIPPFSGLI